MDRVQEEIERLISSIDINLDDVDVFMLDSLKYKEIIKLHYEVITKIREDEWVKIRTKDYWEVWNNLKSDPTKKAMDPKTGKEMKDSKGQQVYLKQYPTAYKPHKRRKLLIAAYLCYKDGSEMNWDYLKTIAYQSKIKESAIQSNLNFDDERKV